MNTKTFSLLAAVLLFAKLVGGCAKQHALAHHPKDGHHNGTGGAGGSGGGPGGCAPGACPYKACANISCIVIPGTATEVCEYGAKVTGTCRCIVGDKRVCDVEGYPELMKTCFWHSAGDTRWTACQ
jgi:hypothetical protein